MRLGVAVLLITYTLDAVWARTGVATSGDCSVTGTSCQSVDCCGTATPKTSGTSKTVCNTASATSWVDTANNNAEYYFTCTVVNSAYAIVASTTAMSSLAAMVLY